MQAISELQNTNKITGIRGNILTDTGFQKTAVWFENGKIRAVGEAFNAEEANMQLIEVGEAFVVPGFIDLHMHGIHQYLIDNGPADLKQIAQIILQYGITSFLPTVCPRREGEDISFLKTLAVVQSEGANILGFHLEGPFIKLTGSLVANTIAKADPARVKALIDAAKPYRSVFSISPDLDHVTDIIPLMAADNTPVFMTHTAANVEQTRAAIALGASHATHFYDVFPCPPVTEPGVRPCGIVEAILADEQISVDFILDGVHVDPIAVKMAMVCKANGPGRVCLITDSNIGAGLHAGRFVFGENGEVEIAYKGAPVRKTADNTLAGSGLTMDQAVRNAMQYLEIGLPEAVTMASANPARVLGVSDKKGKIEAGFDADMVVLDADYNVVQTWVSGERRFVRGE
ncbi:N-acetylglucosamine-6-phosphate deacetylase [Niabella drilacis]|uniref:N-acetylglucosamine-6-phosphate deacetylase n=1 Tax=Niabella drilacis (strain DSM 25811 / CCM 8410 / CCUG 62505 / LMG 26954 / E90) TaxID=1285928 RepID=A0A1G6LWA2_NIADE|nr:N-acetylglucosamine-6-phosphate deacetylase [Niabella drilacis]SDC46986.1 N-acetylglucosamine-6-phosphate deacetylase [Niabella drilacis]